MPHPITSAELPQVAALLARAFLHNPALVQLLRCPDPAEREWLMRKCILHFARMTHQHGLVEVEREGGVMAAASLAFPPGTYPPPWRSGMGMAWGVLRTRPSGALRFLRFDQAAQRHHPSEPHWYLWFLGVEPTLQGRGIGSRLIRSLSARADAAGQACYLETDREENVALYRRHGYQLASTDRIAGADTQMWFMPRPAGVRSDAHG